MLQAKDNVKELSRIGVNSARTFEQTSRDTATARLSSRADTNTATSKVYIGTEEEDLEQRRF
jgi:hypothetical protein